MPSTEVIHHDTLILTLLSAPGIEQEAGLMF